MKKAFIISDIHGFYNALRNSLKNAGYDLNNENHHLIVLGDMFDRGPNSKEVFTFLYNLSIQNKVTIIRGNHDQFLIDFLKDDFKKTSFNIKHNGFGKTLESFANLKFIDENDFESIKISINEEFSNLLPWLEQSFVYLEVDNYIFVHGGINPNQENWRNSSTRDFLWSKEYELDSIPNKIVVSGHQRNATILNSECSNYKLLFKTNKEQFDIIYLQGKILIDRFVEVSNELNVLLLDINI